MLLTLDMMTRTRTGGVAGDEQRRVSEWPRVGPHSRDLPPASYYLRQHKPASSTSSNLPPPPPLPETEGRAGSVAREGIGGHVESH